MFTRQKRNSRLGPWLIPCVCAMLIAYFLYHARNDDHGWIELSKLEREAQRLGEELMALRERRKAMEAKTSLLRDGTLEYDMLDQAARDVLNLAGEGEIIILRK